MVSGTAKVTCGDNEEILGANQSTYVPQCTAHRLDKFASETRFHIQSLTAADISMDLPPSAETVNTENTFKKLWNLSVAKSTWGKYNSGLNAFACFEADHCTSFPWPLTTGVFRAFATWCVGKRNLQPSTVRTYLSSLKFVHHMRGLPCDHLDKDKVMTIILRGAFNHFLMKKTVSSTRRVVTFPLLRVLGHRIARSQWDPLSKQVIWSAATTAFFASTRLGEILASEEQDFSPSSDLLWEDVIFTDTPGSESVLIRLKQPKSGEKEGEYVDLFPFLGYNCCPVRTLRELRAQQIEAGTYHPSLPVFRFKSGANLTPSHFNTVLADLLSDLCSPRLKHHYMSLILRRDPEHCQHVSGTGNQRPSEGLGPLEIGMLHAVHEATTPSEGRYIRPDSHSPPVFSLLCSIEQIKLS